ncbi:MAG: hypothetical protein FWC91_13425 [Defluviitaleaceae bacterium]|nr:hypothetical protein [Defluviitaleaceae bacterium]
MFILMMTLRSLSDLIGYTELIPISCLLLSAYLILCPAFLLHKRIQGTLEYIEEGIITVKGIVLDLVLCLILLITYLLRILQII